MHALVRRRAAPKMGQAVGYGVAALPRLAAQFLKSSLLRHGLEQVPCPAAAGQRPARPPRDADFYQSGAFSARRDRSDEHTYWPFEEGSRGSRPRSWDQARPAGERRYPKKKRHCLYNRQQVTYYD